MKIMWSYFDIVIMSTRTIAFLFTYLTHASLFSVFIINKVTKIINYYQYKIYNSIRDKKAPGGVLPEKLGRAVRPAFKNPYPIYDQNV